MTAIAQRFVDGSSNNDPADLNAYAAAEGHTYIAFKATEGTGYTYFLGNAHHAQCHALGIAVGRYHWVRPDSGTAKEQAVYFFSAVKPLLAAGDFVFPDSETSYNYSTGKPVPDPPDPVWAQFLLDFTAELRKLLDTLTFHVPILLYTANWYLSGKPHLTAVSRRFPAIAADYYSPPGHPVMPAGFKVSAHQFTSAARVAGFPRPVDYNVWIIPLDQLGTDPRPQASDAFLEALMALDRTSADYKAFMQDIRDESQHGASVAIADALRGPGGHKRPFWWFFSKTQRQINASRQRALADHKPVKPAKKAGEPKP